MTRSRRSPVKPEAAPPAVPTNLKRVSQQTASLILRLAESGQKTHAIAKIVGFSDHTVNETLRNWCDVRELAKRVPYKAAVRLSEAAVEGAIARANGDPKRDPEQAVKLLKDIDVLPKDTHASNDTKVQIIVATPHTPVPRLPGDTE